MTEELRSWTCRGPWWSRARATRKPTPAPPPALVGPPSAARWWIPAAEVDGPAGFDLARTVCRGVQNHCV